MRRIISRGSARYPSGTSPTASCRASGGKRDGPKVRRKVAVLPLTFRGGIGRGGKGVGGGVTGVTGNVGSRGGVTGVTGGAGGDTDPSVSALPAAHPPR